MMEYLIVQVFVACLLAIAMHEGFFKVESGTFDGSYEGYSYGVKLKNHYQRILGGLSLPVP